MAQHHEEEREPRTIPEGAGAAVERVRDEIERLLAEMTAPRMPARTAVERVRESIELLVAEMTTPAMPARAAARRVEGMVGAITGEIVDRERIAWVQGE